VGIGIELAGNPAAVGTAKFGGVDRALWRACPHPWAEWDRAVEAWKAERRAEFERKKLLGRMQSAATQQALS
jgi:hypothetical protein